jgi:putative nucleotidyltransferase with HDIG domain
MNEIQIIIKGIDRLDPIPQVANKVMSILESPDSSVSELAEVIKYDPSLTANILKICNSAYFGLSREINSVQHAVNLLGMNQVADLVLMSSAAKNLKKGQEGYDLKEGELWRYSVSSALLARDLAAKKGQKDNHFVFTAALLKDIGKLVLNQYVADSYEKINALVNEDGLSFREAEKEVIGIDHAELGGMVADKWKFSDKMVNIIRNHHLSEESSISDFETSIVYLADTMCMMMGIGVGCDGLAYRFYQDTIEELDFSQRDFQEIMAGFGEKLYHVEELVSFA